MKKIIFLAPIFGALLFSYSLAKEKSAFGAGDITETAPYGLTQNEKVLLKNTKQVDTLDKNLANIQYKVNTLEEQMEGIRSVLDGTNSRMNSIDQKLRAFKGDVADDLNTTTTTSSADLQKAFALIEENRKVQASNNAKIKKVLTEISSLIDSINANYVPKSSLKELEIRIAKLEGKKTTQKAAVKPSTTASKLTGSQAFKKANELLANNSFEEAKKYFNQAIEKKYKPARSNFLMGEAHYKQKLWAEAIKSYKKSVELYDKADYMPKLLYHTAISFDKLGDTANANKFYQALKASYPDTKEAKASPTRK